MINSGICMLEIRTLLDNASGKPTSLGVSFMKYKDFNFLKLNVFADENISFGVSPVSWNFASKLAVVQDLSVEAGIESKTTPSFYVGISTKF